MNVCQRIRYLTAENLAASKRAATNDASIWLNEDECVTSMVQNANIVEHPFNLKDWS